jgi:hypothetical protein
MLSMKMDRKRQLLTNAGFAGVEKSTALPIRFPNALQGGRIRTSSVASMKSISPTERTRRAIANESLKRSIIFNKLFVADKMHFAATKKMH